MYTYYVYIIYIYMYYTYLMMPIVFPLWFPLLMVNLMFVPSYCQLVKSPVLCMWKKKHAITNTYNNYNYYYHFQFNQLYLLQHITPTVIINVIIVSNSSTCSTAQSPATATTERSEPARSNVSAALQRLMRCRFVVFSAANSIVASASHAFFFGGQQKENVWNSLRLSLLSLLSFRNNIWGLLSDFVWGWLKKQL
jgi:hypothetical protein